MAHQAQNQKQVKEKAAKVEHQFSKPWDDSDLVLLVEDEEFHVHKMMLKMASPVFKVMFESDFKEKDKDRIPLPGKKRSEFLDFIKLLYHTGEGEITLKNVGAILKLADEYGVKSIKKACKCFIKSLKKTEENALEVLVLSEKYFRENSEEVLVDCLNALGTLSIDDLKTKEGINEIFKRGLYPLLLSRVEELENCLADARAQIYGLLIYIRDVFDKRQKVDDVKLPSCDIHCKDLYYSDKSGMEKMLDCEWCRSKLLYMSWVMCEGFGYAIRRTESRVSYNFSNKPITFSHEPITKVLDDMKKILPIKKRK